MAFLKRSRHKRSLVVGLDGVPHSLLVRFMDGGVMPQLARIMKGGHLRPMTVTLPEISAVSWPSFMTGSNPGTHGIYGFSEVDPETYRLRFPSFSDLRAPTIWDRLAEQGKQSIVLNQPSTYPARKTDGILVSGFVAVELPRSVWPIRSLRDLRKIDYQVDIDTVRCRTDHKFLFEDLDRTLECRRNAVDLFWDAFGWDYFELVVTGTDRLQHYLWRALDDEQHQYHDDALEYYRKVDTLIGELFDRFARVCGRPTPEEGFFMLSDHGFTGIKREVYLNAWLKENGYLGYSCDTPQSLEDISGDTRAFALDPSRIYINTRGRFGRGCVPLEQVEPLKNEIKEKLTPLAHDGTQVIETIHDARELYSGPEVDNGPDLVVQSVPGYDLKGSVQQREVFVQGDLQGMHTWNDAFFWSASESPREPVITDIAELILSLASA